MEHSPGPWRWDEKNDHGSPLVYAADGTRVVAFHQGDYNSEPWWEVEAANARLIAAAPELLEALAALLAWDNCECGHPHCERGKAAAEARALVRRIEPPS
jgi:hypothetical protein